jgi:signal peptidase I
MTAVVTVAGALALVPALLLWLRHTVLVVTVAGQSMQPTLRPGDRLVVRRREIGRVRPGQVVVARLRRRPAAGGPAAELIVKRVLAVPGDQVPRDVVRALRDVPEETVPPGRLVVLGDNHAASVDSRQFGYLHNSELVGVVGRHLSR